MLALMAKPVKKIILFPALKIADGIADEFPTSFYPEYGYIFAWWKYQNDPTSVEQSEDPLLSPKDVSQRRVAVSEGKHWL